MFKNKMLCYIMNISYFVLVDDITFIINNHKEWIDIFYEVSDFCLDNHVLC